MKKDKTSTVYVAYIHRGRQVHVGNEIYRPKVGAVAAVVDGTILRVGWSLCNNKEGDRFNPEMAVSLAEGRARCQHNNSLNYSKGNSPSTAEMIRKGVPQSCLSAMSDVINRAMKDHGTELRRVHIFNTKTERKEPTPQLMW